MMLTFSLQTYILMSWIRIDFCVVETKKLVIPLRIFFILVILVHVL
jgi:hypothetical protein